MKLFLIDLCEEKGEIHLIAYNMALPGSLIAGFFVLRFGFMPGNSGEYNTRKGNSHGAHVVARLIPGSIRRGQNTKIEYSITMKKIALSDQTADILLASANLLETTPNRLIDSLLAHLENRSWFTKQNETIKVLSGCSDVVRGSRKLDPDPESHLANCKHLVDIMPLLNWKEVCERAEINRLRIYWTSHKHPLGGHISPEEMERVRLVLSPINDFQS